MMSAFAECSSLFELFIARAVSALLVGLIVILALIFSKKWFLGLIVVPPIYFLALKFSELAFFFITLFTLGLPLLYCL